MNNYTVNKTIITKRDVSTSAGTIRAGAATVFRRKKSLIYGQADTKKWIPVPVDAIALMRIQSSTVSTITKYLLKTN